MLSYGCAAMSSRLLSSFSFHVEPSSKNSFFQIGTVAFSSSISQWTAWGQTHGTALDQMSVQDAHRKRAAWDFL